MSRMPVFEDTVWEFARHRGRLQYSTTLSWGIHEYKLVMTIGARNLHIDLYAGTVRSMILTVDFIDASITRLERFAFDSVVYYLSQATPLVGAIQDPLPYWQH